MLKTSSWLLLLSVSACLDASEQTENVEQAQQVPTTTPKPGELCHVSSDGIVFGTMSPDGWCCGYRVCNDPTICGADYGVPGPSCGNCAELKCEPNWLRPGAGAGVVRLVTAEGTEVYVKDDPGYRIPFTPTVKN